MTHSRRNVAVSRNSLINQKLIDLYKKKRKEKKEREKKERIVNDHENTRKCPCQSIGSVNWKPSVIIIANSTPALVNPYAPQTMSFLNEISVTRVSESRINARKET